MNDNDLYRIYGVPEKFFYDPGTIIKRLPKFLQDDGDFDEYAGYAVMHQYGNRVVTLLKNKKERRNYRMCLALPVVLYMLVILIPVIMIFLHAR